MLAIVIEPTGNALAYAVHRRNAKSAEVRNFSLAVERSAKENLDIPSCNLVDRKGHRPLMPEGILFLAFPSLGGKQENNCVSASFASLR